MQPNTSQTREGMKEKKLQTRATASSRGAPLLEESDHKYAVPTALIVSKVAHNRSPQIQNVRPDTGREALGARKDVGKDHEPKGIAMEAI